MQVATTMASVRRDFSHSVQKNSNYIARDAGRSEGGLLLTIAACVVVLCMSAWSVFLGFTSSSSIMGTAFLVLAVEGIFFAFIILVKYGLSGIYCFEPFTIITIVMILVYFVAPIVQFAAESTSRYGVDVSGNCVPGTALVMLGYFAFFCFYEFRLGGRKKYKCEGVGFSEIGRNDADKLLRWSYSIWVCAYALSVFYYTSCGFDIVYVVSGGLAGVEGNEFGEGPLAFLSYMKFVLLGSWMMIYAYGTNWVAKMVTFALMVLCMFLGGGRATLLIGILAPIVFSYARRKRSPKFSSVALSCGALVFLFAFMQVARVGLRSGVGLDMSGVTLDELFNPFYTEIDDFKAYYALFDVVPEKHDFLLGSEMIVYSLVLLIPRAIFPGKPNPAVHDIVGLAFGNQAVVNGVAYPAIGEYYIEFGIIGVIVIMAILGIACRCLKRCYEINGNRSLALMAYSVVYPSLMSVVLRGYFPQIFSMLLFLLAPFLLFWLILRASNRGQHLTANRCDAV